MPERRCQARDTPDYHLDLDPGAQATEEAGYANLASILCAAINSAGSPELGKLADKIERRSRRDTHSASEICIEEA
jgi:hypothetical protein